MSWSSAELKQLHENHELVLVLHRDGHPELRVPVWPIVTGGELYVRSWKGVGSVWFRRVLADAEQAVELDGRDIPVRFERVDDADEAAIDDGYNTKYAVTDPEYIPPMHAPIAIETTMRISKR
ncbi:MAG: DUF2255 family protein [Rhodoglobus sp.]